MRQLIAIMLGIILCIGQNVSWASNDFISLCYHDVRDDVDGIVDDDQAAVSTDNLVAQLSWLREHDYHFISLDQVITARAGGKPLPDNAVLLTFDDGYKSTYTHVFPLLKLFNVPAVVAVVGRWLETPTDQQVRYGSHDVKPRDFFMSWAEVAEMSQSSLVEIASHSHDMHKGILGNPQGNLQPAAVTFQYDKLDASYESRGTYEQRIARDLAENNRLIQQHTGTMPRAIVWPYGAFSRVTEHLAMQQGLKFSLTLTDGKNTPQSLNKTPTTINRLLIQGNPPLADFVYAIRHLNEADPIRVAHVDLDYVYDPDPEQENKNLSRLLDRIKYLKINTVYLQAFADPDGDGNADALYFPNRHLPMRRDLFNRVAWQLQTRSGVQVYAWMPVLSFIVPNANGLRVHQLKDGETSPVNTEYLRLSPFNREARQRVSEIYEDLAIHANFSGLLFHDDAYLSDFEDFSPAALRTAAAAFKAPELTVQDLKGHYAKRWQALKTSMLTRLTIQLANQVKIYRPEIKTARNMYANVLMNPDSQAWFNQRYSDMLLNYDYTAIMAMPYMEQAKNPSKWLVQLANKAKAYDPKLKHTVFELQSIDWRTNQRIPDKILQQHFRLLMRAGVANLGYYPDNFLENHPEQARLKSTISLSTFPFGRRQ